MSSVSKRKKPPPIVAPSEKAFPSVKTIILKENHPQSKGKTVPSDAETQPGVWSQTLSEDIVLQEGDQVLLKSSFIDTEPTGSAGLITISKDDVDQLSITTGMYWQDSGNGVPMEKYAIATFDDDGNMSTAGISYNKSGPVPQMSQVMKSDIPEAYGNLPISRAIPNGQNYILQNQFDSFTNTILYLNPGSAVQTGADPAVESINGIRISKPGSNYTPGSWMVNQPLTGGSGTGARADFATTTAPGPVTSVVMTDEGHGYAQGNILDLPAPVLGSGTTAQIEVLTTHVNMSLELKPNANYDPTSATHEYFDYTIKNALETTAVPAPPGGTVYVPVATGKEPAFINGQANPNKSLIPFVTIGNILNLRVRSNPLQGNEFFIYPAEYSGAENKGTPGFPFPVTDTPGDNDHMGILISTVNPTSNVPQWNFVENNNWNNLGRPLNQGFVFEPASAAEPINFGSGAQGGTYRICMGIWVWIWVVGKDDDSGTYPAEYQAPGGKEEYNYYNIELDYYSPGNVEGGGRGSNVSKKAHLSKQWTPTIDKRPRLYKWFDDQFPPFVSYNRTRYPAPPDPNTKLPVKSQIPAGIDPPINIFPSPPTKQRGWPHAQKSATYPSTESIGYFAPAYLSNMADESSTTASARNIRSFPPFIYDANPIVHVDSGKDPDVENFAPFRITASGSLWQGGRKDSGMEDFQQCGFIQQDSRGPIIRNPKASSQPNVPFIGGPAAFPPIWKPGNSGFDATTFSNDGDVPKFAFNDQCVISKPFIPGSGALLTPRLFTTKLKDIPGNTLPKDTTTYTHAAWARILTDTLNRTSLHNLRLSNQPSSPTFPTNKPTYSSSRLLTDTVQLGYQGTNFPSNRFGLGFNYAERPSAPAGFPVADSPFSSYFLSEQPYWVTEDGNAIFKWKDGVPQPAPGTVGGVLDASEYATVDPITASHPGNVGGISTGATTLFQQPYVYGQNGPKWAGAEAFSIIFNDTSSAYEIIQMHSNIYSASSGAPIIKTFRSGLAGAPYPDGIQELTVADQTGGVFITDWQPRELWEKKMNFDPTVKVSAGGMGAGGVNLNTGDFTTDQNLSDANTTPTTLQRGLNITGNFRAGTDFIDRRVNIPNSGAVDTAKLIGGNYQSPVIPFDMEVEVDTPVTILGGTITPAEIKDPFFMIEVNGINTNEMHGLSTSNNLISSIVGRYFAVGSYTQGSSEGSIAYTHRGEPMTIRQIGIRILASDGTELTTATIKDDSAVILEIAGQDISLSQPPPTKE